MSKNVLGLLLYVEKTHWIGLSSDHRIQEPDIKTQ